MKKKFLAAIAVAGMLAVVPVFAFAAPSATNSSSDSGGDSGYVPSGVTSSGTVHQGSGTTTTSSVVTPGTTVTQGAQQPAAVIVDAYGTQTTNASTVVTSYGTISVKTNGTTTQGHSISYNQENGHAVYGPTEVALRGNGSAVAGLSDNVRNTNNSIDAAGTMAGVVAGAEGSRNICTGLNLNTLDPATGLAKDEETEIDLKVDYLDEGMQNLIIGGYSNAGNHYVLGQVVKVDYTRKIVTVRVPGSGTYWLASR